MGDNDAVTPERGEAKGAAPAVNARTGPKRGATATPEEVLQRHWGYGSFRPLQREAIEAALGGRDALVVLPTGGGKSLCYQVPAACGLGLAMVVSPLIALMDDQVAAAREAGLRAAALHSNLDEAQRRRAFAEAVNGRLDLLYVSPERLVQGDLVDLLAPHLGLAAIDEAHCVSHWGHDFRPEYRQLAPILDRAGGAARMALTATATAQVREDIVAQLGLRSPRLLIGHPDRPNLVYRVQPRTDGTRQVIQAVRRHPGEGGIVYTLTRREAERMAEALRRAGIEARPYHAGLDPATRRVVQDDFVNERLAVVTATVAFGMGIDRSNVRFVVHADLPRSIEHYQQESGRAGRDGEPAECLLLAGAADLVMHRRLAERDGPLPPERQAALNRQLADIGRFAVAPVCRHRLLVEHFGHRFDPRPDGCGACDVCLGETSELPPEEALTASRKILSAVWRCESRFGLNHVIEVLRGSDSEKISRHGHHRLSVFGLMADVPAQTLRSWIDQLVVQGYLAIREENRMPLLGITEAGRLLCRETGPVRLGRFEERRPVRGRVKRERAPSGVERPEGEEALFQGLRTLRRLLAAGLGVPPYIVFSDATLQDLAFRQPRSDEELLLVKGVGETKLRRYGRAVLSVLGGADPAAAAAECLARPAAPGRPEEP
jgi:ATP-dependent DNA helicase RecQ